MFAGVEGRFYTRYVQEIRHQGSQISLLGLNRLDWVWGVWVSVWVCVWGGRNQWGSMMIMSLQSFVQYYQLLVFSA